ncbi:unnamed protein product [Effrenium voratum]|uniref:Sfi1 spindle body domain-containing protein n=1 Tax=Effrenium voratum TaxID=2562239 RepID=A0AA36I9C1_9DINO|nr:unnamed protein product [Effrenium voratum]
MLRVSATHRERRRPEIMGARLKFRTNESTERLHAGIIGRSLGRSFANVLLLTKVLMAFREVMHLSVLGRLLQQRTSRLRREKAAPDVHCAELVWRAWRHITVLDVRQRASEAEIVRGRAALVRVFARGREDLSKAVELLHARQLQQTLQCCIAAWRDALRIQSLESYSQHLEALRERTPGFAQRVVSQADEAHLLSCLVCWAASVALTRQGRLLKDTEMSLQEMLGVADHLQKQLQSCEANKARLQAAGQGCLRRSTARTERELLKGSWLGWRRLRQASRWRGQRLAARGLALRLRRAEGALQAWQLFCQLGRQKRRNLELGQSAIAQLQKQQLCCMLDAWVDFIRQSKEEALREQQRERRRIAAEHRFWQCACRTRRAALEAWRNAHERRKLLRKASCQGEWRRAAREEQLLLRLVSAWRFQSLLQRSERQRCRDLQQVEASKSSAVDSAFQSAMLALERCQEQPGPFHLRLLAEWHGLVVQRKTREARKCSFLRAAAARTGGLEEMLLTTCFHGWQRDTDAALASRAAAQSLRCTRREMRGRALEALRGRRDAESESLQLLLFMAWQRCLMQGKLEKEKKDKALTSAFGQLMLDDEMLRSRVFNEWRQAVYDSHRDAWHASAAREAAERQKEAHEQKLNVMRQAFRSSDQALLGQSFSAWHGLARSQRLRAAARDTKDALNLRRALEIAQFTATACLTAWHCRALQQRLRRQWRLRRSRCAGQLLRFAARGLAASPELLAFQAQLLELWLLAARLSRGETRRKYRVRRRGELLLQVVDSWLQGSAVRLWHQQTLREHLAQAVIQFRHQAAYEAAEVQRQQKQRALLQSLLSAWLQSSWEGHSQRRVAASCQNAREVQLFQRGRMLQALRQMLLELELGDLQVMLLRWCAVAKQSRWARRAEDRGVGAAECSLRLLQHKWLSQCFSSLACEALLSRRRVEREAWEAQAKSDRDVHSRLQLNQRKALAALRQEQSRAGLRGRRAAWAAWRSYACWKGHRRRRLGALLQRSAAAAARDSARWNLLLWCLAAREDKALARFWRCRLRGSDLILRLRGLLMKQQAFRGWQHVRAYEELFKILSETQADLAQAADAAALAETAAAAAQQRNQQVTVRVLPTLKPAWSQANAVTVVPESALQQNFNAPALSLQKDIQRHYGHRLQDRALGPRPQSARRERGTPNARECSFEVNISPRGEDPYEAWP